MKKNVWIFNHYAGHMVFEQAGRHYGFAKYLKKTGYTPTVFCANNVNTNTNEVYFDTNDIWTEYNSKENDINFVFVNTRKYIGNGKKRVLNMIDYYKNVKKSAGDISLKYGAPDIIYASSVHPLALVAGIQIAKKYNIECICEIRDLWPESIIEYGVAKKNNPLVIGLRMLEKWIYCKADKIVFTGGGFYDYIEEQKWNNVVTKDKVYQINNGIDIQQFNHNREQFTIKDIDLENEDVFKIVYAGSIRKVNNLGLLLDVAKKVRDKKVKFLIWGDGDELPLLKKRVEDENIKNIVFKGRVEKKYIPYIVSNADLNIAHNNPSKLFRFGVSFNKIFDYLAAGKPILCDFPSKYNPVIEDGAGFEVADPFPEAIADAIDRIVSLDKKEYDRICQNAIRASNKYDFKQLTESLINIIEL